MSDVKFPITINSLMFCKSYTVIYVTLIIFNVVKCVNLMCVRFIDIATVKTFEGY